MLDSVDRPPKPDDRFGSELSIDVGEIKSFLDLLDPDRDQFLIVSFDDDKYRREAREKYIAPHRNTQFELIRKRGALKEDPKNEALASEVKDLSTKWNQVQKDAPGFSGQGKCDVINADPKRGMLFWMRKRQSQGCGIFACVQAMQDGKVRKNHLLAYVRAVFVEDDEPRADGQPRTDWPLKPSIVVQSSPGKYHYYWLVKRNTDFDRECFEGVMRRMIADHGSDPNAKDVSRVMRLPGTCHLKGDPFQSHIVEAEGFRYGHEEIIQAFPPIPLEKPGAGPRQHFNASGTMERFTEPGNPLDKIPADEYDTWLQVGMGLHHESGGSSEGLNIWRAWSSGSTKFNEGACEGKWSGFKPGTGMTGGVIYALAKDFGWCREDLETEREKRNGTKASNRNSSGYSGNSSSKRGYGHNSGASDPIQDDPIPLFRQLNSGAEFPVDALGPIIGPTVKALHESAVQAPIAMCAASALAAAAISTQTQANIALPHGEVVPLSLYLLVIAESGERKSSLHKRVLDGVGRYTKELEATYKEELFKHRVERAAWEAEKRIITNDKKIEHPKRIEKLSALGPEPTPPKGPFLMVKEPTMQGLDKVMIAGQHSVGLFTSEAGEFLGGHAMGKERITGTLAQLNSLWDGDGIERIRAGEEPVICRDRRMSLFFQIQPHLSTQTLTNPIVRDIGFLSRLLICRPESAIGSRFGSEPTNEQTRALLEFSTRSFQLMKRPLPLSDDGILEPPELTFTSDAAKALTLFNHFIEKEMAEGGSYEAIRGFASKLGQHAARLAGVMILFENADADEIGIEHLQRGIDIALYGLLPRNDTSLIKRSRPFSTH